MEGPSIQCPKIPFTVRREDWPRYTHKTVETIFQASPELHEDIRKGKQQNMEEIPVKVEG